MAWAAPALCKVVTASTGTNDYVLSDPSSQGPYRTDVQAVADGSLANGQTVHYVARDTTVTNDASFEEGYGVYTSATRAVARTAGNVIDSDGGPGVLKSWGLSGQRDFYILGVLDGSDIPDAAAFATNLGLPRLAAANEFTAIQVITQGASTGQLWVGSDRATGTVGQIDLFGDDSAAGFQLYSRIASSVVSATAGAESGRLAFSLPSSGSFAERLRLDHDGTLTAQPSGNAYLSCPAGSVLLSESVWPGFTRDDVTGGRLIKLSESGDTLGATGGSDDPFDGNWGTAGHTLTISQIPAHTHDVAVKSGAGPATAIETITNNNTGTVAAAAKTTGGGGSHFHTIVTPNYRVMGRIVKS